MIFNVSDLYPETAVALGMLRPGAALTLLERLEAWCYRRSALVTGQTRGIVSSISSRFPHVRVRLLTNGVDCSAFGPERRDAALRAELGWNDRFVLGYAGILGHAQGLHDVLHAAARLQHDPRIAFALFGDGPLRHDLERKAEGLANVVFHGHVRAERMPAIVASWDAGLVPLAAVPLMRGALPSKMFEIMGSGVPVILFAPSGEASVLVDEAGAGIHVESPDAVALAQAIRELVGNRERAAAMGTRGRSYVRAHFDRSTIAAELARDLEALLA